MIDWNLDIRLIIRVPALLFFIYYSNPNVSTYSFGAWTFGKRKTRKTGVNVLIPLSCVLCSEFRAFPVNLRKTCFSLSMLELRMVGTIFVGDMEKFST